MNKKIVGIFVMMLLIVSSVLPVSGMIKDYYTDKCYTNDNCDAENIRELPWIETYVFLEDITMLVDWDDGLFDCCTELVVTATAWLDGENDAMTFSDYEVYNCDVDDGHVETTFPKYRLDITHVPILYDVRCSPIPDVKVKIGCYDVDLGSKEEGEGKISETIKLF